MTKQNSRCPLQQECERVCKVVGHERHCDYYVNNRYGTSGIPDQDQILDEEDARKTQEWAEEYFAVLDEDEETDGTKLAGDSKRIEPAADVCKAEAEQAPAFDYAGLDEQTVADLHLAEREYSSGRKLAEVGLRRMADGVAIAHDALCGSCDKLSQLKHGNRGENTFRAWCESMGLNCKAAERLLQVAKLMDESSPREQKVLEELSPSLLYAAAKPSAPAELVQGVKAGDITTHKQYQELLAEIRNRDAKISELIEASEASGRRADAAERRAREAERMRDGARDALQAAKLRGDKWQAEAEALKAHPIEAQVVDEEEINRRAKERAAELTAPLREELEALRNRHPADPEAAEQAIRDAYDSTIYTGRVIENAWHTLRPLLPCMDAERRDLAINNLSKIIAMIQGEIAACL